MLYSYKRTHQQCTSKMYTLFVVFMFLQLSTSIPNNLNQKKICSCYCDDVSRTWTKTKLNTNIIPRNIVLNQECVIAKESGNLVEKKITNKHNIEFTLKKKNRFIFPFKNILLQTNYSKLEPPVSLWG